MGACTCLVVDGAKVRCAACAKKAAKKRRLGDMRDQIVAVGVRRTRAHCEKGQHFWTLNVLDGSLDCRWCGKTEL